ncbi:MAG: Tetratricopeptide repeat protein [Planctomycetes bacterium ADurb.Bin412]|nr:MAG: Tetratricopeptide repeat protein [Planctomycetes bacterium ADurb.Bin412]
MSTHEKTNKLLVSFALEELSEAEANQVRTHLSQCEMCRREYNRLKTLLDNTEHVGQLTTDENIYESAQQEVFETVKNYQPKPNLSVPYFGRRLLWRTIMKSRITKLATAAAVLMIVSIGVFTSKPVYGLTDTIEAMEKIHFIHVFKYAEEGRINDEKWIEIDSNGYQARFRQESNNILIIDDTDKVIVYRKDKNTVILYDVNQKHYQWIANLGKLFRTLAGKGEKGSIEIERNVSFENMPAHRIHLTEWNMNVYIDPSTKLPIAIGPYIVNYENPPADIFAFDIPDGVLVLDKRPGANSIEDPDWMKDDELANRDFKKARQALAEGEYSEAVELFMRVVAIQPMRNWAVFWLGKAQHYLHQDKAAIEAFSDVISMFQKFGIETPYAHLARGLAYAFEGLYEEAKKDLTIALPVMIQALRNPKIAKDFDYADDPLYRDRNARQREMIENVCVMNMIHRLRQITSQKMGEDLSPDSKVPEEVIAAWENWYHTSGEIQVDFDYQPDLYIPEVPASEKDLCDRAVKFLLQGEGDISLLFSEAKQVQLKDYSVWSALGLGLYKEGMYVEALEAFQYAEQLEEKQDPEHIYGPITWQGHVLDLLGRREEAIERYESALKRYSRSSMYVEYGNFGIKIDDKWIQKRLEEPFDRN